MRRHFLTAAALCTLLTVAIAWPIAVGAASVAVSRPTLSKTTGITTATRLTARGFANPVPTNVRSVSAALIVSKRSASGTYVRVKSVPSTLKRVGRRVNYAATFGPLARGSYKVTTRVVWVTTDRKSHAVVSLARVFTVAAATWTITEESFAFSPSARTIRVGDKVVFRNKDSETHQVRINGRTLAAQGLGASVTWIAPRAGTFPFLCVIHTDMKGRIVVR